MGDTISLGGYQLDPIDTTAAVLKGAQTGQQLRAMGALQGVDVSDPDSVNQGIGGLVKAGALEQADALTKLSLTRQRLSMLPKILGDAQGALAQVNRGGGGDGDGGQAAGAAGAAGAGAPPADQAGGPATPQFDPQHALDTMNLAKQAVDDLARLPMDQRGPAFAQVKADMMKRGIPEEAIDAAGTDLSDEHLAGLSDYYGNAARRLSEQTGAGAGAGWSAPTAAPEAMALHPTEAAWARRWLQHPEFHTALQRAKAFGFDLGDPTDEAEKIAAPGITKQAELDYAPAIGRANADAEGKTVTLTDHNTGRTYQVPASEATEIVRNAPPGTFGDMGTEAKAAAQSRGTAEGSAPYDLVTLPVSGRPTTMFKSTAREAAAAGMPGFGQGLTPGESTSQEGDAKNLQDFVGKASSANLDLQKAVSNGQKITALAGAVSTGKFGPQLADLAATFPLTRGLKDYASNAGLLSQDLSASFKDALGGMSVPRLNAEAGAVTGAIPKLTSQPDQIRLYGTSLQAAANYQKSYNDFVVNFAQTHPQSPSLQAAQAAWNAGPGRVSILADPAYRSVKMSNGHPAVIIDPKSGWGVFLPGTPEAFKFRAQ